MSDITRGRVSQLEKRGQRKIKNRNGRERTEKEAHTPLFNSELEARNHIILHYWIPYTIKKSFTQSEEKEMLMKKVYPLIEIYYSLNGRVAIKPPSIKEISLELEISEKEINKKMSGIKKILKSTSIPRYIIPDSPTYHQYLEGVRTEKSISSS